MRTETITLARALDVLANDIKSTDGIANAAISEAAERLRWLHRDNERLDGLMAMRDARLVALAQEVDERRRDAQKHISEMGRVKTALADALSTFRNDDKTVIVSAERQEAWRAALDGAR